jgi:predicted nucleic acid-binding protein
MILADVNLLVDAWESASPDHAPARDWLDAQLSGDTRVGLPWESTLGFLRIVTNPLIFAIGHAWRQVQEWLNCDNVWNPAADTIPYSADCCAIWTADLI